MTSETRTSWQIGLIGAGRIGTSHAGLVAEHVPGARLAAVADPRPGAAERPRRLARRAGPAPIRPS